MAAGGGQGHIGHTPEGAVRGYPLGHLPGGLGVEGGKPAAAGPQPRTAGAAACVPGLFRNVAQGRGLVRAGLVAPVVALAFVELGAAHRQVERGGGQARYGPAGAFVAAGAVATGRAIVARGHQDADALQGRLGPQVPEEGPLGGAQLGLALAETEAQHRGQVVLHRVAGRQVHPVGAVGGPGKHEADAGVGGHRAGPFHVQGRLAILAVVQAVRGGAVAEDLRGPGRQAELVPEGLQIRGQDRGPAHHGDAHAGAIDARLVERLEVVDGGEIPGGQVMPRLAVLRCHRPEALVLRPVPQVVQGHHPFHHVGQGFGDGGVLEVALVAPAVQLETADGGAEGLLHLAHGAGEHDGAAARGHLLHLEASGLEPGSDPGQGLGRGAELGPELLRGAPPVVVGGAGDLDLGQLPDQAGLGCGRQPERQDHARHGGLGIHRAQGGGGGQGRRHVPGQLPARFTSGQGRGQQQAPAQAPAWGCGQGDQGRLRIGS